MPPANAGGVVKISEAMGPPSLLVAEPAGRLKNHPARGIDDVVETRDPEQRVWAARPRSTEANRAGRFIDDKKLHRRDL